MPPPPAPRVPSYEKTTALVAKALGLTPEALIAGFRPATRDDLAQVVAIRGAIFGAEQHWDDAAYLTWRYHFGADTGRGECWIATRDGAVIGVLGTEKIVVQHGGRSVTGQTVMDIAVVADAVHIGLGPWMAMTLCQQSPFVLAIGSNLHSLSIITRIMTRLPDRRCYAHLVRFDSVLGRRLRWRLAVVVLDEIGRSTMRVWRVFMRPRGRTHFTVKELPRFDAAVDALVESARDDEEVTLERTRNFLNWRLFDNPRVTYTVLGAYAGAQLVGYMAVHVMNAERGRKVLAIEDWLIDPDAGGAFAMRKLLGRAVEFAVRSGCERVSLIAYHRESERVLPGMGFFEISNALETLSVRCTDEALNRAITGGAPWRLTGVNTDRDV